jgi:hypothetical protein
VPVVRIEEAAKAIDQERNWRQVRKIAKLLDANTGLEFTKGELLNFNARF